MYVHPSFKFNLGNVPLNLLASLIVSTWQLTSDAFIFILFLGFLGYGRAGKEAVVVRNNMMHE